MKTVLRRPTVDLVTAARDKFDRENEVIERALKGCSISSPATLTSATFF
jgi:hypothetical protein